MRMSSCCARGKPSRERALAPTRRFALHPQRRRPFARQLPRERRHGDIFLAYADDVLRINFWGDEIDGIEEVDGLTGARLGSFDEYKVYPANLFMTTKESQDLAIRQIQDDLVAQVALFKEQGKTLEAQRLEERVSYDLEMIRELGHCSGIENYSRYFDGRQPGMRPLLSARLFPERLSHGHRRKPRQCATNPRHVRRRPLAQRKPGELRLPPARRARQPPAQI